MPIVRPEERLGTVVASRYRLDTILGYGGMGVVFAGLHLHTGRRIALKCLLPQFADNHSITARFLQEARLAATFRHPHVVEVLDLGSLPDGGAFMVMAFLEGDSLSARIEARGRLHPDEALEYTLPIAHALGVGHARGIVHRDLKPDNIFLAMNDVGVEVPTLLDFGIAKRVLDSDTVRHTETGALMGTPAYMAPEQAMGAENVTAAADQWSLAVVLFECLSGRLPYAGSTPQALLARLLTERPPRLCAVAPDVPAPFGAAIDRALQHNPQARYASITDMARALLAAAQESRVLLPHSLHALFAAPRDRTGSFAAAQTLGPNQGDTDFDDEDPTRSMPTPPMPSAAGPVMVIPTPTGGTLSPHIHELPTPAVAPPRAQPLAHLAVPTAVLVLLGALGLRAVLAPSRPALVRSLAPIHSPPTLQVPAPPPALAVAALPLDPPTPAASVTLAVPRVVNPPPAPLRPTAGPFRIVWRPGQAPPAPPRAMTASPAFPSATTPPATPRRTNAPLTDQW